MTFEQYVKVVYIHCFNQLKIFMVICVDLRSTAGNFTEIRCLTIVYGLEELLETPDSGTRHIFLNYVLFQGPFHRCSLEAMQGITAKCSRFSAILIVACIL